MAIENIQSGMPKAKASEPSLIEHFSIQGLYGYRTVTLSSKYAATVLIAKNGSGKTTLLGALDAFLRGQITRLANLHFSKIRCKLRGVDAVLELDRADVDHFIAVPEDSDIYTSAIRYGVSPAELQEFVLNEYPAIKRKLRDLHENEFFEKIRAKIGYSSAEARKICDRLAESVRSRDTVVGRIQEELRKALGETEVVYLPTYRRIELPLADERTDEERAYGRRRRSVQARLGLSKTGFFNTNIQFGLADIDERLHELNQEILFSSNQGYREISANIINELLDGSFREGLGVDERPDKESLSLFFSRLKEGRHVMRLGDVAIPNIDKIYNEGASTQESNDFLQYFLGKLNAVIQVTRGIESLVEDFIDHCNAYLSDCSSEYDSYRELSEAGNSDGKKLHLDRKTLKVHVESMAVKRRIPMDSLSSGEKQVISLFARLYLYKGPKIVLIDEPELSLSMEWQRKILLDVVNAPNCLQAIAITHSPFVFDNDLEPYAKSLSVEVEASSDAELTDIELEDELNERE